MDVPKIRDHKTSNKISHLLGWNRKITETSHRFITGFPGMSGTTQPHRFGCHLGEKRQIAPNIGNPWFNVGNSSKLPSPWNTMLLMQYHCLNIVLHGVKLYILYDILWYYCMISLYDYYYCMMFIGRFSKAKKIQVQLFWIGKVQPSFTIQLSVTVLPLISPHIRVKRRRGNPSRPCSSVGTWVRKEPKRKGMKNWKGRGAKCPKQLKV